ncbi:hypothetical protein F53441_1501 [Fusarium austroafricanum]|uniref:SGNH hydrolase-type esterase domain-containing protein n=1 Tax=Fusarium austroafricanum TaxID=2364996 RepID=A0A8H4KUA0_9HYPO|nr:hypothetical protein F53441_1501 [Fusarium austroafricanum]
MYKQRSHETHHGTHIPQITSHPGQYTVALLGDSLFERFKTTRKMLSIKKASHILNLGVGGDKVVHVQYRINQGLLNALKEHQLNLKQIYLHIGSNNLKPKDPNKLNKPHGLLNRDADAYDSLLKQLRAEFPDMRIVVTALFIQREMNPNDIEDVNVRLENMAGLNGCEFLPFGDNQEGIMLPDDVHLNDFGYAKWDELLINDMNNH